MRGLQYLTQSTKVAGSDPAPATKKALGIPRCTEDLLVFGIVGVAIHSASVARIPELGVHAAPR